MSWKTVARARRALMARSRAKAPWGMRLAQATGATFHAVTGRQLCGVRMAGQARVSCTGDTLSCHRERATWSRASHKWTVAASGTARRRRRGAECGGEIVLDWPGNSTKIICAE